MIEAHLETLREKHAQFEQAISDEAHRPLPDTVVLHDLKRQKLKLKETIARLEE